MYLGARRFAEYYVPAAALAGGLLLRDAGLPSWPRSLGRGLIPAALTLTIALQLRDDIPLITGPSPFTPSQWEAEGAWLRDHAAPGEMIYNASWDSFPFLVWHAPGLRYLTGLDPHYLKYGNPAKYEVWQRIQNTGPDEPQDPAPVIRDWFGARWVVVDRWMTGLAARLFRSPEAELVLQSPSGGLFRLRDRPGGALGAED